MYLNEYVFISIIILITMLLIYYTWLNDNTATTLFKNKRYIEFMLNVTICGLAHK